MRLRVLYLNIFIFIWDWGKSGPVIYLHLCLCDPANQRPVFPDLTNQSRVEVPLIKMTASWWLTYIRPPLFCRISYTSSSHYSTLVLTKVFFLLEKKDDGFPILIKLAQLLLNWHKVSISISISVCSDAACGSPCCVWSLHLHCREHTWKIGKGDNKQNLYL